MSEEKFKLPTPEQAREWVNTHVSDAEAPYGVCREPGACLVVHIAQFLNPKAFDIYVTPSQILDERAYVAYEIEDADGEFVEHKQPLTPFTNALATVFDDIADHHDAPGEEESYDHILEVYGYFPTKEEVLAAIDEAEARVASKES